VLDFIQRKFYSSQAVSFAKDRPRLLGWVVLKLAVYLDDRAVTISPERYLEIMTGDQGILMEALRFGNTGQITYLPAWLGKVVESHLAVHGDEYYEEGKALRNHLQSAINLARAGLQGRDLDPIRELAAAARLLKPARRPLKRARNDQPSLL
jgi:hypothetical protein